MSISPRQFDAFMDLEGSETITLTPGVIDDNARSCFSSGHCKSLSAAIAGATGWEEEHATGEEGNYYDHSYVKTPWGTAIDIEGESSLKEARRPAGSRGYHSDEMPWSNDLPGMEEAVDFVKPVLESAGLGHVPLDLDAARKRVQNTRDGVPHSDRKQFFDMAGYFQ